MRTSFTGVAALAAALSMSLVGCSSTPAASTPASAPAGTTTVTVFAAASMKATFTALGKTFEANHPGATVVFNFAGSQTLAEQIVNGAAADAFASANEANMTTVTGAGLASGQPKLYATSWKPRFPPLASVWVIKLLA